MQTEHVYKVHIFFIMVLVKKRQKKDIKGHLKTNFVRMKMQENDNATTDIDNIYCNGKMIILKASLSCTL